MYTALRLKTRGFFVVHASLVRAFIRHEKFICIISTFQVLLKYENTNRRHLTFRACARIALNHISSADSSGRRGFACGQNQWTDWDCAFVIVFSFEGIKLLWLGQQRERGAVCDLSGKYGVDDWIDYVFDWELLRGCGLRFVTRFCHFWFVWWMLFK